MVANWDDFEDAFNKEKTRNIHNTYPYEYNCGGYALETFSWYRPCYAEEEHVVIWGDDKNGLDYDEETEITEMAITVMLKEFNDLRIINNLKELCENEYAIAFRIGCGCNDFHFMKRHRNGHWSEKCGGRNIHPVLKKDVFAKQWYNGYDTYSGKLILFAKKF